MNYINCLRDCFEILTNLSAEHPSVAKGHADP